MSLYVVINGRKYETSQTFQDALERMTKGRKIYSAVKHYGLTGDTAGNLRLSVNATASAESNKAYSAALADDGYQPPADVTDSVPGLTHISSIKVGWHAPSGDRLLNMTRKVNEDDSWSFRGYLSPNDSGIGALTITAIVKLAVIANTEKPSDMAEDVTEEVTASVNADVNEEVNA